MVEKVDIHERILMAGFPGTGKSTFLAAFWQLVETQSDIINGSLRLHNALPVERAYLNGIRDEWLSYKPLPRTPNTEIKNAYIDLGGKTGEAVKLSFPDISGETYTEIVEKRIWSKEYHQLINETNRLLLFINDKISSGSPTISQLHDISGGAPAEASQEGKDWEPRFVPTQVKYIDLLQLLTSAQTKEKIQRISVVISAWDRCANEGLNPDAWLEKHAPMLYQFLKANADCVEFQIFGVSAQGNSYEDIDINGLTEKSLSERTLIAGEISADVSKHDITYPVRWLFE